MRFIRYASSVSQVLYYQCSKTRYSTVNISYVSNGHGHTAANQAALMKGEKYNIFPVLLMDGDRSQNY